MYTYTTPTITCTLTGLEFSQVDYVRIAVESKRSALVRVVPVADIDTETGNATSDIQEWEHPLRSSIQFDIFADYQWRL